MMLMKSLASRNFVSCVFSWQYLYYCLNADGVQYLKDYLGVTGQNIVPETFKRNERRHIGNKI